jgi:predicted SprT family Zn-dependent metalloprotease
LQAAYDFFNEALFGGKLRSCLITLQRRSKRTSGYYWARRFAEIKGKAYTDEIAMNPQRFTSTSLANVLATLVHEQVHLWQFHFGKPSRGRYHNKEWADKMRFASPSLVKRSATATSRVARFLWFLEIMGSKICHHD